MEENNHSLEQAKAQYECILEMLAIEDDDERYETIQEDPLEIAVRSDWHEPGRDDNVSTEYKILLCTGGPAVRIIGELDDYNQPSTAKIQHQDWFTGWQTWHGADEDSLLEYANHFWFGE